jgi:hypothetical protein
MTDKEHDLGLTYQVQYTTTLETIQKLQANIQELRDACEAALPFLREHHLFKGQESTPAGSSVFYKLEMALWNTR